MMETVRADVADMAQAAVVECMNERFHECQAEQVAYLRYGCQAERCPIREALSCWRDLARPSP